MLRNTRAQRMLLANFSVKWAYTCNVAYGHPLHISLLSTAAHIYVNVPFMYGIRIIRTTNAYTARSLYEPEHNCIDVWRKCLYSKGSGGRAHTYSTKLYNFVLWANVGSNSRYHCLYPAQLKRRTKQWILKYIQHINSLWTIMRINTWYRIYSSISLNHTHFKLFSSRKKKRQNRKPKLNYVKRMSKWKENLKK